MLSLSTERCLCWSLLAATFALRAIQPDQPIVENYVGRQIPTAMVARNLERGSGFLRPQLDTGPLPNLFLIEPPIYALAVASFRRMSGFPWPTCGRLTSAAGTTLAAWGLFGMARRREGPTVALLALASFCLFPVMIRYGRAFQPDALMLGFVLAGLRGWDEYEASGQRAWLVLGGFVLATGLAIKITSAWALIPFWLIARRLPVASRFGFVLAMLAPAFAWYSHAWGILQLGKGGSTASGDNAELWLGSIGPASWVRLGTIDPIARNLLWRGFTPVGFVLAAWGLTATGPLDRAWKGWAIGCGLAVLALAPKWHHGYYWMVVAPLAAVGVGRGLVKLARFGRWGVGSAVLVGFVLAGMGLAQSASTWRTPEEWRALDDPDDRRRLRALGDGFVLAAPEALIYYMNTEGYRLEFAPDAIRRAAGEWGGAIPDPERPMALVDYYRRRDAADPSHFSPGRSRVDPGGRSSSELRVADVGFVRDAPRRRAWREAIRAEPGVKVEIDRDDLFVATLPPLLPPPPPPSPGPPEGAKP